MAKSNKSGQINFYRSMLVLGLIVIGFILNAFLNSAPRLSGSAYHKESVTVKECLDCHMQNVEKNPIMPHRSMDNCTFCHKPEKKS
jgi:hypothetical protein